LVEIVGWLSGDDKAAVVVFAPARKLFSRIEPVAGITGRTDDMLGGDSPSLAISYVAVNVSHDCGRVFGITLAIPTGGVLAALGNGFGSSF
jgi:hypothetical protein